MLFPVPGFNGRDWAAQAPAARGGGGGGRGRPVLSFLPFQRATKGADHLRSTGGKEGGGGKGEPTASRPSPRARDGGARTSAFTTTRKGKKEGKKEWCRCPRPYKEIPPGRARRSQPQQGGKKKGERGFFLVELW